MAAGGKYDGAAADEVMRELRRMSPEGRSKFLADLVARIQGADSAPSDGARNVRMLVQAVARDQDEGLEGLYVRPVVWAFAQLMEYKLRCNDHKKDGWCGDSPASLYERVKDEAGELGQALETVASGLASPADYANTAMEAADVANMLMMLVDVLGLLPTDGRPLNNRGELDELQASHLGSYYGQGHMTAVQPTTWQEGATAYNPTANASASTMPPYMSYGYGCTMVAPGAADEAIAGFDRDHKPSDDEQGEGEG